MVTSEQAGMGKTLFIKHLQLQKRSFPGCDNAVVPIHGPAITCDKVIQKLNNQTTEARSMFFHLDLAYNVSWLFYVWKV